MEFNEGKRCQLGKRGRIKKIKLIRDDCHCQGNTACQNNAMVIFRCMRARVSKKIWTGRIWRVLEDTVDVECTLTKKDGVKGSIADRHESKRQEITEKTGEAKGERGIGRRGEVYAVCKRSRGSTRGEIHQHRNPMEGLFDSFLTDKS